MAWVVESDMSFSESDLSRVIPVGDVEVVDRSLLYGDAVVSKDDPLGQMGTVVNVHVLADVKFYKSKEEWWD